MRSINNDILYDIDNSINNEKAKHRIKQEIEKLDYEKQYYIKEIERLNNIINKLEKFMDEDYEYYKKYGIAEQGHAMGQIRRIKNKLQELKGDGSNDSKRNV